MAASLLNPTRAETETNSAIFQIPSAKLYVLIVTLSIDDSIKFLEHPKNNLYDYMADPTYRHINR